MKNKKVIIGAIALLVIAGVVIVKNTYFSSKSEADETYYVIEDEDTEYEGEEITTEYLPSEEVEPDETTSQDDVVENTYNENEALVKPEGKYSAKFTDEIEGEEISYEVSYTFNSDGTGVYNGQDTIDFTWDAENKFIMINDGKHPFELNDDCLTVEEFHGIEEYYKDK